ncbi:hypothetical protein PV325_009121 [Microctonus aethiopoides]|uniref:Uncharacterized protein n=1 Tax=Microctonus aethiopoides TaxID=144406 RepID=A0AA39C7F6_9HYME|nr:hypothetical protein PV325_009121 [Microctonus aethiopoides]KAK0092901.1 hypothetical protein PV326_000364 [Microctonus aethiopoides]KAK0159326.1 hypothetical protein PV328_010216 [Microctonus aethiopoides]
MCWDFWTRNLKRSRHLTGTRDETFDDDLDCLYDGYSRGCNPEDDIEDEFVSIQRRFKQRAADAFEEDLAELRRKRRDLQDRLFDMVDVGAEISKAKTTLENANVAFLKHAKKFDNNDEPEIESENLVARLEKTRKMKKMVKQNGEFQEAAAETTKPKKVPLLKWSKFAELENEMPKLVGDMTKARIRDEVEVPEMSSQSENNKQKQSSERRRSKKRSVIKRKKGVTF